jgi:uncharacterized protein (DUF885 family)
VRIQGPLYIVVLFWLLLVQFKTSAIAKPQNSNLARSQFNAVVDEYFDLLFQFHPSDATADGFHQYDGKLEDFTAAGVQRETAALKSFLPKLDKARSLSLPQQDSADLEFIRSQIQGRLLELEQIRMWERDPDAYASAPAYSLFLLIKRNFAPLEARLRSVISREEQVPAALQAARRNLKNPPKVFTDVALQQLSGTIDFFRQDIPQAFSSVKDEKLQAQFRASNEHAISALRAYEEFLRADVLPVSRGDFRLGEETFRRKLLYDEMVDIPLDRLREIAYADLHRNQQRLKEVAAQIDPKVPLAEVLAAARNDHPAPTELLQSFRDVLASLRSFIDEKHIITIPSDQEPVVEETPPFARALTTAAMETPGPYDTMDTKGIFEVTLPDSKLKPAQVSEYMQGFNRGTIVSTAIHEVFPGHYEQYLWSMHAPSKVRKLLYCGTNSEGWAHYTEQMMLDEGYSTDPRLRLGQLIDALLRDSRFIAGLEMHTGKMSIEQAREFFIHEGYQVPPIAAVEARRGASDPTYLVYTLGKLQIMKLREDYKQQKGDKFSLKEFHDHFIDQGGLPLKIIRRSMLGNDSPTL